MAWARRRTAVVLLVAVLGAVVSAALIAADHPVEGRLVLNGSVTVGRGENVGHVLVLNGTVTVDGSADAVTVLNGDVVTRGEVRRHAIAMNGTVRVLGHGRVGGDVVSRRAPVVAPTARVDGSVQRVSDRWLGLGGVLAPLGWLKVWSAVTASALALALLALAISPNGMVAAAVPVRRSPIGSLITGFAVLVGVPLASLLAIVTLAGIPLGISLLLGAALLYPLGYVVTALTLGLLVAGERRGPWLGVLAGLGLLRLVALVPVLGLLVGALAVSTGLGGLTLAVTRARRTGVWSPGSSE